MPGMQESLILPSASPMPPASTAPAVVEQAWAVAGLHCAACAEQLRAELLQQPGVLQAQVGYAAAVAVVRAPQALQAELPARMKLAGYLLAPLDAASGAALREAEARTLLWRLFVAGFCMMQVMMLAAPTYFAEGAAMPADLRQLLHWGSWVLSWPVLLFSSQPFLVGAWRSLKRRQLGMDVPVALGALVAFAVSSLVLFDPAGPWGTEVYFDSFTMFIAFLLGGRWFELKARHAAAAELAGLMSTREHQVQREGSDGRVETLPLADVRAGDVLRVGLGETVPVDGSLLEGETLLDESLLSGESLPVRRLAGELLVGGSLNLGRPLRLRALAPAAGSRAAQLAQRLQAALTERPAQAALADRWATHFLAAVLVLALGAGLVWFFIDPAQALRVVCAVLIVTCPCAFALAQPAARVASFRALLRQGLLLQRLPALEALAHVDRVWLDKTGTLTRPEAQMRALLPGADQWAGAAVSLASWSRHPVAQAVARCAASTPGWRWREVQELPGQGLRALDEQGRAWWLGRHGEGQDTAFGRDGEPPLLAFDMSEAPLPGVARWLKTLQGLGLQVGLLSGDQPARVERLAQQLDLPTFDAKGGCSPEDKLSVVKAEQAEGRKVLMVGDGVNDAPVLAQADASLAVAGATPLAAQAADAWLLRAQLDLLPVLILQARRTQTVMRQNLVWAAAYNLVAVPLALLGYLPPWAAGLGMALSSLLVVGNAMRLARD